MSLELKNPFKISEMFQAPVLTTGHRLMGVAAVLGACFVITHVITVTVTCVVNGFGWGINAWVLDIAGFLAGFYFAIQCALSSSSRSVDFKKANTWIFTWAAITLPTRILDVLMLFGIVKWSEIYITPEGPTLWSNVVSEIFSGLTFATVAFIAAAMLLWFPKDVDSTQGESA